jgi:hypothetical protein
LLALLEAGCVQAIGPRPGIGDQPTDRLIKVGTANEEAFGAANQQHFSASLVDGGARRLDPRHRLVHVVKGFTLVARGILDRKTGNAGFDAQSYVLGNARGVARVAAFEVRVHRQVRRLDDLTDVGQHRVARDLSVGTAARESESAARRR